MTTVIYTWHQGGLDLLTAERLHAYFAALLPIGVGTLRRKRASLRSFLRWAEEAGYCPVVLVANSPLLGTRPQPMRHVVPTLAQITQILAQIPPHQERDRVLFHLLAASGLHLREVLSLRLADCQVKDAILWICSGNRYGELRQIAVVDPVVVTAFQDWLTEENDAQELVFRA